MVVENKESDEIWGKRACKAHATPQCHFLFQMDPEERKEDQVVH